MEEAGVVGFSDFELLDISSEKAELVLISETTLLYIYLVGGEVINYCGHGGSYSARRP